MDNLQNKNNEFEDSEDKSEGKSIKGIKSIDKPNPTIDSLIGQFKNGILKIPDFQRKFVWTIEQSSKFIESLLLGLPIPSFMFYEDAESNQLIVDGQQRMKSIIFFVGDDSVDISKLSDKERERYKFELTGLSKDSKYKEKTFQNLDEKDRKRLLYKSMLDINLITLDDTDDLSSIYYIFERLNTGGTPLKPQEIRNCICAGKFNEFLIDLNKNKEWQSFITSENDRKRQRDVELILRFFALYETYKQYKRPMDEFLTLYFDAHRNIDEIEKEEKAALFNTVVSAIYKNLGRRPFHIKNGLNSGVCDSVMVAFANNINNIPLDIKDRFFALTHNGEFYKYCGKNINDNESVQCRIQIATDYLFGNTESL